MAKGLEQVNDERRRQGYRQSPTKAITSTLPRDQAARACGVTGAGRAGSRRAERTPGRNWTGGTAARSESQRLRYGGQEAVARGRSGAGPLVGSEDAWRRLCVVLPLFAFRKGMPRRRATQVVAEVLPQLTGEEWAKVRRLLKRPEVFTYLDQVEEKLAALPAAPGVASGGRGRRVAAASRTPAGQGTQRGGGMPSAAPARACWRGGAAGTQAAAAVRGVLQHAAVVELGGRIERRAADAAGGTGSAKACWT